MWDHAGSHEVKNSFYQRAPLLLGTELSELSEHMVPSKVGRHPVKDVGDTGRRVPARSHDACPSASVLKRGRVYIILLDNTTTFGKHSVVTRLPSLKENLCDS